MRIDAREAYLGGIDGSRRRNCKLKLTKYVKGVYVVIGPAVSTSRWPRPRSVPTVLVSMVDRSDFR